jgi:hypothetical protein
MVLVVIMNIFNQIWALDLEREEQYKYRSKSLMDITKR